MDDHQFKMILDFFGLSFKGYKKVRKGVKKRLVRQIQELGCSKVYEYILRMKKDAGLRHDCRLALTVSISRFFRDRTLWKILGSKVLPCMAKNHPGIIRVWSAGCARGEEAYSLKIAWEKMEKVRRGHPGLTLLATDLNAHYLAEAQNGVYGRTSLKEVEEEDRKAFFDVRKNGRQFVVKPFLKTDIVWQVMDLCSTLPDRSFDLIFLRNNVLTYLDESSKALVFQRIVDKLEPGGILVKGAHETIPQTGGILTPAFDHPHLFQKNKY